MRYIYNYNCACKFKRCSVVMTSKSYIIAYGNWEMCIMCMYMTVLGMLYSICSVCYIVH